MSTKDPLDESAAEALAAALTPYPWRRFTPDLLARWVVAASDRNSLGGLLGTVPGSVVGEWDRLDPADPGDPRVDSVFGFLTAHRWSELSLDTLCAQLMTVLHRKD